MQIIQMMAILVLILIDHGFKKMIADIEAGKINMVVVKDLSRFARTSGGLINT